MINKELKNIQKLDSHVIDQISAGEVVERPAHLVKELIENALDAKAQNIEIQFSDGGLFTSIKDDGEGIHPNQLSLALSRHTTSKIKESRDLFSIQTYGFRGEALASIASVSCLSLISRFKDSSQAFRIKSQFGKTLNVETVSGVQGTTVIVDRLFQNVPVRLKFLKSESVETLAVKQVILSQALSHPHISFRVIHKNRLLFFWPACSGYLERAEMVLNMKPLYHIKSTENQWVQELILSPPHKTEKTSKKMKFFVNGRCIEDKVLYGAVVSAHRNLLMHGEYPVCVLHFSLPSEDVDVNVHPTKNQVRFRSQSAVFRMTQKTARDLLEKGPWLDRLAQAPCSKEKAVEKQKEQSSLETYTQPQFSFQKDFQSKKKDVDFKPANTNDFQKISKNTLVQTSKSQESLEKSQDLEILNTMKNFSSLRVLAQAHKTYLVTQSQESIVFIDQHAAHERILFEKIMDTFRKGKIEKQKHLMALSIEMDPAEVSAILLMKKSFQSLGIEMESQKPNEIQVLTSPLMIKEKAIEKAIQQLAHNHVQQAEEFTVEKIVSDFSATAACHSAIRAGQILSIKEMANLLNQMDEYSFSSFCPHGRPVFVEYPISKLEKDFCRTV